MSKNLERRKSRLGFVQFIYSLLCHEDYHDVLGASPFIDETQQRLTIDVNDHDQHHITQSLHHDMYNILCDQYRTHHVELHRMMDNCTQHQQQFNEDYFVQNPLLYAILSAGCCELYYQKNTDAHIVINDYIEIAKSFFDQKQPALVNAYLDYFRKSSPN